MVLKIYNSKKDLTYIKQKYVRMLRLEAKRFAQHKAQDPSEVLEMLINKIESSQKLLSDEKNLLNVLKQIQSQIRNSEQNKEVHSNLRISNIFEIINK